MRELLSLSSERYPCSFLGPLAWLLVPLPLLRGLWILLLFPLAVWPYAERGIIIAAVASHFFSQEIGAFKSFVFAAQFHFGHNEAFVFAEELVHFKRVAACRHEPADFVDDAGFAETEERERFELVFATTTVVFVLNLMISIGLYN